MRRLDRQRILILSALAALGLAALWSVGAAIEARHEAEAAALDAAECSGLANRIVSLRGASPASADNANGAELTRRIAAAASAAKLPAGCLDQVEHDGPARVQGTQFVRHPTHLTLRSITLRQLVTFLHALAGPGEGLNIENVDITAPTEPGAGGWSARAIVASMTQEADADAGRGKTGTLQQEP